MMRLTCPNCDAQYEVDESSIPDSGRDVQCSNCGHAWFQLPPDLEEELQDEAQTFGDDEAGTPAPVRPRRQRPSDRPAVDESPEDVDPDDADEPGEAAAAAPVSAAPRRSLDDGLKRLLREEVEREHAARKAESGGLETQPELGLDASPARPAAATPEPPPVEEPAAAPIHDDIEDEAAQALDAAYQRGLAGGARRDLLPDIEEINSTLRANSERGAGEPGASADAETPAERRRGFRRGFSLVLLIAVILALIYIYAAPIARKVPSAAGPLHSYVQTVDKGRAWLNGFVDRATRSINGSKGGGGS